MSRPVHRIPGHDVDRIDVVAGLRELSACGYSEPETVLVIEYALKRWARGEEEAAQRGAIDQAFRGISLTCWLRVLSAARARAEETAAIARKLTLPQRRVLGAAIARPDGHVVGANQRVVERLAELGLVEVYGRHCGPLYRVSAAGRAAMGQP